MVKNFLLSFLVLFGTWLLLSTSLSTDVLIVGAAISLLLTLFFLGKPSVLTSVRLNPKALLFLFAYFWVFLYELMKSNLDVALRVVSPKLKINPGIVKVKTRLKSKMGRLLLANSITLTPGTLTVEILDDTLFIHWIDVSTTDVKVASREIVEGFEKYLEVIYG